MQSQVDIPMARSIVESWQNSRDASTTTLGDDMDEELKLTLILYLGKFIVEVPRWKIFFSK